MRKRLHHNCGITTLCTSHFQANKVQLNLYGLRESVEKVGRNKTLSLDASYLYLCLCVCVCVCKSCKTDFLLITCLFFYTFSIIITTHRLRCYGWSLLDHLAYLLSEQSLKVFRKHFNNEVIFRNVPRGSFYQSVKQKFEFRLIQLFLRVWLGVILAVL